MTASPPKVNGHTRPPAPPVLGDWQPIEAAPTPAKNIAPPTSQPEPAIKEPDAIAQAEAGAIRARAWAESEERRLAAEAEKEAALKRAEAEAEAVRVKAVEDNRRAHLANDRAERKEREEKAASKARIAESRRKRDEADRAREEAARQARDQQQAEENAAKEIEAADEKWRSYAIRFAIVCGIVSLPVQMSFFWNPHAPWMAAAPVMLEGAAWVVHRGARAAAVSKRPIWHYRTIVWLLAFIAAGINLYHGLHSFDPGTALATAFASVAGPGVWDLHEHGRIRKRDGVLTRRERKAAEKAAEKSVKQKAAEDEQRAAEKEAAEKAAEEAAKQLAERRSTQFPKVWEHAEKLATDLGLTTVTQAIWERAKLDVEGARPGESAEVIRMRNAAEMRVAAAREKRSVNGSTQQAASQMPGPKKPRIYKPPARPGRRTKGDVKYTPGASRQASIAARNAAAKNTRPNDN